MRRWDAYSTVHTYRYKCTSIVQYAIGFAYINTNRLPNLIKEIREIKLKKHFWSLWPIFRCYEVEDTFSTHADGWSPHAWPARRRNGTAGLARPGQSIQFHMPCAHTGHRGWKPHESSGRDHLGFTILCVCTVHPTSVNANNDLHISDMSAHKSFELKRLCIVDLCHLLISTTLPETSNDIWPSPAPSSPLTFLSGKLSFSAPSPSTVLDDSAVIIGKSKGQPISAPCKWPHYIIRSISESKWHSITRKKGRSGIFCALRKGTFSDLRVQKNLNELVTFDPITSQIYPEYSSNGFNERRPWWFLSVLFPCCLALSSYNISSTSAEAKCWLCLSKFLFKGVKIKS